MSRILRNILVVSLVLFALAMAVLSYLLYADQRRIQAGTNPCEHDCLQDSGGIDDCRKLCAGHPTAYGPASQSTAH